MSNSFLWNFSILFYFLLGKILKDFIHICILKDWRWVDQLLLLYCADNSHPPSYLWNILYVVWHSSLSERKGNWPDYSKELENVDISAQADNDIMISMKIIFDYRSPVSNRWTLHRDQTETMTCCAHPLLIWGRTEILSIYLSLQKEQGKKN